MVPHAGRNYHVDNTVVSAEHLHNVQEDARAVLKLIAEHIKCFYNKGHVEISEFKVGNKVYVEQEHYPKGQPMVKLAPQRDRP